MVWKIKGRRLVQIRVPAGLSLAAATLLTATEAAATLEISSTTNTTYAYGFAQQTADISGGGDINSLDLAPPIPGAIGKVAIDTVSTVDADSFYFLQNLYCIGLCAITATTHTAITLFNNSETETLADLRFDSLITPGHLARAGTDPVTYSSFLFSVDESKAGTLYMAIGVASETGLAIDTFGSPAFNGLNTVTFDNGVYADWGATNLNLLLSDIGPMETLVLTYNTITTIAAGSNSDGQCFDASLCAGAQVVFGDPRRSGNSMRAIVPFGAGPVVSESIIGREYDAFGISIAVNTIDDPIPADPIVPVPPTYTSVLPAGFAPTSAVPEPASWAMMVVAFGIVGAAMRRRRPIRLHTA